MKNVLILEVNSLFVFAFEFSSQIKCLELFIGSDFYGNDISPVFTHRAVKLIALSGCKKKKLLPYWPVCSPTAYACPMILSQRRAEQWVVD